MDWSQLMPDSALRRRDSHRVSTFYCNDNGAVAGDVPSPAAKTADRSDLPGRQVSILGRSRF
jgi:hypothetical protein